ncbi:type II toxin-antitoxin system VapC family toxin [Pontiellaceae bacterium B12227]|nr:type II toxin-antitoxin system VapC family toxin [Pontiellaceae bacterium B12227]
MATPILVDTDVMIDFLRGNPKAGALLKANTANMILPAMVVAELYAGVRGDQEKDTLDALMTLFRIIPVSAELARKGGLLKNQYCKSHGTGLADAIIAATAIGEKADLKTLNTKHYPMLKGLRAPYRKS